MFPFVNTARIKIFLVCVVLSLLVFAATRRFNRHCPICYMPVSVEYGLTLGVLGCVGDHKIVHTECVGAWDGSNDLANSFSLH